MILEANECVNKDNENVKIEYISCIIQFNKYQYLTGLIDGSLVLRTIKVKEVLNSHK